MSKNKENKKYTDFSQLGKAMGLTVSEEKPKEMKQFEHEETNNEVNLFFGKSDPNILVLNALESRSFNKKELQTFGDFKGSKFSLDFDSFFKKGKYKDKRGNLVETIELNDSNQKEMFSDFSKESLYYARINTENKITSFCQMKYRLPYDTNEVLRIENVSNIENYDLYLNKTGQWHGGKMRLTGVDRKFLREIRPPQTAVLKELKERQKLMAESYLGRAGKANYHTFKMKTTWRMLIGKGTANVYQSGFTLHPVWGIPYIPDSQIKGMLRTFIIQVVFKKNEKDALKSKLFRDCFGNSSIDSDPTGNEIKGNQGKLIFLDAFPDPGFKISADVITVHYGKYYVEGKAPTDNMSPVPLNHLVLENTEFTFYWGAPDNPSWTLASYESDPLACASLFLSGQNGNFTKDSSVLEVLVAWFQLLAARRGIGNRRSLGYGRMEMIKK